MLSPSSQDYLSLPCLIRRLELESKRRKISASEASRLLVGGFEPSSRPQAKHITKVI
ncbi:hypothetical protein Fmac_023927 [Flemingia macrophylla]|uniref:Uncharacterized protein n=1 Tax=Flemingia macrophylla TaxID=520843 RepID=A0ABD1LMX2_9FABA